jgi:putative transposase
MKKSKFSDSQIMAILNQAEAGAPVSDLCREHGMSSASYVASAIMVPYDLIY